MDGHDGLDETGDARRGIGMADVGLDRAEGAEAPVLREMAKGLAQGGEFDGVAEGRPGAVAFDKADITRGKSREGDRLADDGGLA